MKLIFMRNNGNPSSVVTNMGIRLNNQRCQSDVQEITFLGRVITADGLNPDPSQIEAVLGVDNPLDKEAVERLRGTIT